MLGPATILHDDGMLQLACAKDVFVERWIGNGGLAQFQALTEHHRAYIAKGAGPWSVLFVEVRNETVRVPTEEDRALINERQFAMGPKLTAGVMVISSPGFVASVVRGVFSAATLLKRPPYQYKVCSAVSEGWNWLAPKRNVPASELMSGSEMQRWYDDLVRRLSTPASR